MNSTASPARQFPVVTSGTLLLHVDFALTGIVMTFLGPMLPSLSARWSLSDAQSGSLIFAEFLSSMFGMLFSSVLVQRRGYRQTLMWGLLLMSCGVVLLAFGPWLMGILSICIFGAGYGITTPAGNLRTAEINPLRSASALNVINAVWGLGAMSSPFLVALALKVHRPDYFYFGTAAALLVLMALLAASRFVPDTHAEVEASRDPVKIWTIRILPLICAVFFFYVGAETCFGNWVAMYARRLAPQNHSLAIMTPSFFWGALLAGRGLAPFALRVYRETKLAGIGLTIALLGGIGLVSAHGLKLIAVSSVFAGLGLAAIYPISVSLLQRWFGDSARRVSGIVFSSGNVGGAVLPWLLGALSTLTGSLRVAFMVPLAGVALLLSFYVAQQRESARL
jgi:MFS transporter, FHS family, glucose/mannose:H+ symporter